MSKHSLTTETNAARIFDAEAMRRAVRRIAHEIIERNRDLAMLILAGLPARGAALAQRIVAMHRDDLGTRSELPAVRVSQIPFSIEGRTIVIVDDVLFTGRTCRAALDALRAFGRPACIQLAVLIDRGHRELPIRPDFVGKNLPTAPNERVRVRLQETDNESDGVWLEKQ